MMITFQVVKSMSNLCILGLQCTLNDLQIFEDLF